MSNMWPWWNLLPPEGWLRVAQVGFSGAFAIVVFWLGAHYLQSSPRPVKKPAPAPEPESNYVAQWLQLRNSGTTPSPAPVPESTTASRA